MQSLFTSFDCRRLLENCD